MVAGMAILNGWNRAAHESLSLTIALSCNGKEGPP